MINYYYYRRSIRDTSVPGYEGRTFVAGRVLETLCPVHLGRVPAAVIVHFVRVSVVDRWLLGPSPADQYRWVGLPLTARVTQVRWLRDYNRTSTHTMSLTEMYVLPQKYWA